MKRIGATGALLMAFALGACGDRQSQPAPAAPNPAAVLGAYGPSPATRPARAPLLDAHGQPIPAPAVPAGADVAMARTGDDSAVAAWVQGGHVQAASFQRATGWSQPVALEQIHGQASAAQLAGNRQGVAMAVWRHTVGSIQSLRYSLFDARTGWSAPDVVPGALPRPHVEGAVDRDTPQLEMDAQGNVTARWPSGFDAREVQVARYAAGQGWERATNETVAAAPAAGPPAGASSSPRP